MAPEADGNGQTRVGGLTPESARALDEQIPEILRQLRQLRREVRTRRVVVVDDRDRAVAFIEAGPGGGALTITNSEGHHVAWLAALPDQSGRLLIGDSGGTPRASVNVADGNGQVCTLAADGDSERFGPTVQAAPP